MSHLRCERFVLHHKNPKITLRSRFAAATRHWVMQHKEGSP